jgi:hypothetical protein
MDERDIEEEENYREGKGWGIAIKMYFFGIGILCLKKCNQESESP